jgi:hypothetical protein
MLTSLSSATALWTENHSRMSNLTGSLKLENSTRRNQFTLNYSTYEFLRQLQGLQLQSKFILNVWPCITFECIPVVHSHNFPTTLSLIYFAYIKQLCILFICSSPGRDKFMFSVRKHVLGHLFSSFCISS